MTDSTGGRGPGDVDFRIAEYDEEAEATGWVGPDVILELMRVSVEPGQSVLDIGIGTGLASAPLRELGIEVHGMDISPEMLDACRAKGITSLELHDLTEFPYPYEKESIDHVVCAGVFNFFDDLSAVFAEVARILCPGGLFVFIVGDRAEDEAFGVEVGPEHTGTGHSITMYRHSAEQIGGWFAEYGFVEARSRPFTVYMDRERSQEMAARAYVGRKP